MAIKPVIVGTNGSAASARAVAWGVQEASRAGLAAPGLTVDTSLVIDEPAPFLAGLGLSASMLVVGARGAARPGTGQLGSVSRYLATHARCPVVIIPSAAPAPKRQIVVGVRDP